MSDSEKNPDVAPVEKTNISNQPEEVEEEKPKLQIEESAPAANIETDEVGPDTNQEQTEQQITPEEEQEQRQKVMDDLINYGVDKKIVETFKKMSQEMDFRQFIGHAMELFPEISELLIKLNKIDGGDLQEIDKNNEKARIASEKFKSLAERMGFSLTEGEEKLAGLALGILADGGKKFTQWFKNGWENSDLGRLIDAIVLGADYNSATSLKNLESKEGSSIVSTNEFFDYFKKDSGAIDKLIEINSELGNNLNWRGGLEILSTAKNKGLAERKKAIQEYLLKMYEAISSSPAENLVWEQTNILIAKEIFKKDILSSKILKNLKKMHDDKLTLDNF